MKKFFKNSLENSLPVVMLAAMVSLTITVPTYVLTKVGLAEFTKMMAGELIPIPMPLAYPVTTWVSMGILAMIFLIRPLRKIATDPF
ncbi:MAG: hypothetical protein PHG59_02400 [Patescibacteria group bacterium]|jgi:uncharacterized membrane protein|nr:hypothetical protein [Patescibacteria group bacterium]